MRQATDPPLAHQALEADRSIGLLLPCNVVVRAEGDQVVVQAVDPGTMVTLTGRDTMAPVAREATLHLDAALASLKGMGAWGPTPGTTRRRDTELSLPGGIARAHPDQKVVADLKEREAAVAEQAPKGKPAPVFLYD